MADLLEPMPTCSRSKNPCFPKQVYFTACGYPCKEFSDLLSAANQQKNSRVIAERNGVSGTIFGQVCDHHEKLPAAAMVFENVPSQTIQIRTLAGGEEGSLFAMSVNTMFACLTDMYGGD